HRVPATHPDPEDSGRSRSRCSGPADELSPSASIPPLTLSARPPPSGSPSRRRNPVSPDRRSAYRPDASSGSDDPHSPPPHPAATDPLSDLGVAPDTPETT